MEVSKNVLNIMTIAPKKRLEIFNKT